MFLNLWLTGLPRFFQSHLRPAAACLLPRWNYCSHSLLYVPHFDLQMKDPFFRGWLALFLMSGQFPRQFWLGGASIFASLNFAGFCYGRRPSGASVCSRSHSLGWQNPYFCRSHHSNAAEGVKIDFTQNRFSQKLVFLELFSLWLVYLGCNCHSSASLSAQMFLDKLLTTIS